MIAAWIDSQTDRTRSRPRAARNRPSRLLQPARHRLLNAWTKPPTLAFTLAALAGIVAAALILALLVAI